MKCTNLLLQKNAQGCYTLLNWLFFSYIKFVNTKAKIKSPMTDWNCLASAVSSV